MISSQPEHKWGLKIIKWDLQNLKSDESIAGDDIIHADIGLGSNGSALPLLKIVLLAKTSVPLMKNNDNSLKSYINYMTKLCEKSF